MEKFSRSERRFQSKRIKDKRKCYWGYNRTSDKISDKSLGILAQTPQVCSCWMCRNSKEVPLKEQSCDQLLKKEYYETLQVEEHR